MATTDIWHRSITSALASFFAYAIWLMSARWDILSELDIAIVLGVATLATLCLLLLLLPLNGLAHSRSAGAAMRLLVVPLLGGVGWFVFFASATGMTVKLAIWRSLEDRFNNAVQFIWSRDDFFIFVVMSLLVTEVAWAVLGRRKNARISGSNSRTD